MLFENLNQFEKAKRVFIETDGDIERTTSLLGEMEEFQNMNDVDIRFAIIQLNESIGDRILNFLSSSFGGDIKELKTVLDQMKNQELKFNEEEFQIYDEFYDLLEKERQLRKDKSNPDYTSMMEDIKAKKNALNTRMKELTKTHDEIFGALEQKVKDLTGKSNRKKKYFNAQRANDVLLTKNERYDKIKAITQKSKEREKDLEDFFGVSKEDLRKDVQDAREDALKAEKKLDDTTEEKAPDHDFSGFTQEPERYLVRKAERATKLVDAADGLLKLKSLKNEIRGIFMGPEYKMYSEEQKKNIHNVYDYINREIKKRSK
jgi:hypothetical protein